MGIPQKEGKHHKYCDVSFLFLRNLYCEPLSEQRGYSELWRLFGTASPNRFRVRRYSCSETPLVTKCHTFQTPSPLEGEKNFTNAPFRGGKWKSIDDMVKLESLRNSYRGSWFIRGTLTMEVHQLPPRFLDETYTARTRSSRRTQWYM